MTARRPSATVSAAAASSARAWRPVSPTRLQALLRRAELLLEAATRSSAASTDTAPSADATRSSRSDRSRRWRSAPAPVSASIRRCPDPMLPPG